MPGAIEVSARAAAKRRSDLATRQVSDLFDYVQANVEPCADFDDSRRVSAQVSVKVRVTSWKSSRTRDERFNFLTLACS